jgi:hypothetical protein
MSDLHKRIAAARGYADINQTELARRVGHKKRWVLFREKAPGEDGAQPSSPKDLLAIATACDLTLEFFLADYAARPGAETAKADALDQLARLHAQDLELRRRLKDATEGENPGAAA